MYLLPVECETLKSISTNVAKMGIDAAHDMQCIQASNKIYNIFRLIGYVKITKPMMQVTEYVNGYNLREFFTIVSCCIISLINLTS
jgi:hypothetical protein